MKASKTEFSRLEKEISETSKSHLDYLASDTGKVYVVTITRDGRQACERQKPKLQELTKAVEEKHRHKWSSLE